MEQLKVGIGADTKDLERGLKDAEKALKTFSDKSKDIESQLKKNAIASSQLGAEISKLTQDFDKGTISESKYGREMLKLTASEKKLSDQSKTLRQDLTKLNASTKDLGTKGMGTLKKGAISGNSAMTAFSRTVQDAPFGIMGVSNNITNLTEQFGYLKNKTGSAKGALKAMLADLKGFGGISLAISVATSLMLVFGDTLFKTKDKTKILKEEQEKLNNAIDNYIDGLEAVERASLKGVKAAQKETTTLRLLRDTAEDVTMSFDDRVKAVNELQRLYPDYLGNVKREKILNGEVSSIYETLTVNILKRAKATAALNKIIKNSEQLLVLESQTAALKAKTDKKAIQLQNAQTLAQKRAGQERAGSNFSVARANELQKEYNSLIKEGVVLEGKIQGVELENIDLEEAISNLGGIKAGGTIKLKKPVKVEVLKPVADEGLVDFDTIINNYSNRIDNKGRALAQQFKESTKLELGSIDTNRLDADFVNLTTRLNQFNTEVSSIIGSSLASTLGQIGTAFGEALTTGGNVLNALGQTLIQGLAGFLGKMGDLLIEYGTLAVVKGKLDLAIAAGGPVAIAAGLAAIAVGVALKAVSAGIGSFASSGGNEGSNASSTGSGYTAPKSYGGSSSFGNSGGTVVFEIAGQKLVGVLSNTLRQNRSLGGGLGLTT